MSKPQILFVLGSGRSGTSAITRVLSLCGACLPLPLYAVNKRNPRGFWEPVAAVRLNDSFLLSNGTMFGDPTIYSWNVLASSESVRAEFLIRIQEFLASCPSEAAVIIKDPRISELAEFWLEAAQRQNLSAKAVITIRHPCDVAASLGAKPVDFDLAFSAWMKLNLLCERHCRSVPRIFLDLSNALRDWRTEVARIINRLSLPLTISNPSAIDNFLAPSLYRRRDLSVRPDPLWEPWLTNLYGRLLALTCDHEVRAESFDELYEDYQHSKAYDEGRRAFGFFWHSFRAGKDLEHLRADLEAYYPPVWNTPAEFPQA